MKKILSFLLISGASYFGYSQCTTPIVAPWSDGFESFALGNMPATFNCWETVDAGPYWATDNNNTGSLNTGPLGPNTGVRYAYLETSTGTGSSQLTSPLIDISGLANPALTFHWHMYGAAMGTLEVDIWDGSTWTTMWSMVGQQQTTTGAPWEQAVVSLTGVSASVIKIRFNGIRGTSFTSDMSIDDVGVIDCTPTTSTINVGPSCGYYTAPSGKQLHDAGTYQDTIANSVGCDSIITINLTTNNTFSNLSISNICGNYVMPSGQVVGQDGVYYDTTTNAMGCDSVINYNLTFNNSFSSFDAAACNVYTAPSGAQYTLSGIISDTITNAAGCDSVMTINLNMSYDNSITIFVTTCGEPYTSNAGNVYPTTGIYTENFTSSNGCDSIVYIDLEVAEGNTTDEIINACDEFTSPTGMTYSASGTYTETFTGSTGCDSLINYIVTINTVDNTAQWVSAMTIEAVETGATYQWVDCNNNSATIPGATGKIFVATVNGDYACLVTKNGCVEMTNCVRVGSLGIDESTIEFSIYPNPSNGVFAIDLPNVEGKSTLTVTTATGQVVYTSTISNSNTNIDLQSVEAGVYFVSIENEAGTAKKAIVIQ